jgi:hypothetical protein
MINLTKKILCKMVAKAQGKDSAKIMALGKEIDLGG